MKTSLVAFTLVLFGFASTASAQSVYGSLVGSVTDDSGAAVPLANVTATQAETNFSRSTQTDTGGVGSELVKRTAEPAKLSARKSASRLPNTRCV
jgi:hypothetical protein